MKKVLSLFMSIVMLLSITASLDLTANAEILTGNCGAEGDGSNVTYTLDTLTGVLTILGTGKMRDCYSTGFAPWFNNRLSIYSVDIEYGITNIANGAFHECENLESVTIPDSVMTIGIYAFEECYNLKSISMSKNIETIGPWAFSQTAYYDDDTNWEDNVLYIDNALIEAKKSINGEYTIKEGTKVIAHYAFRDCTELTNVIMPKSVTSIDAEAFCGCKNLNNIVIPCNVTSIKWQTFANCDNLSSVTIPISVTSIDAFSFSSGLKDVYYEGKEDDWKNINVYYDGDYYKMDEGAECIGDYPIFKATIHYNYHRHTYSDVVTPASCTAEGYTTHTCTVCGESYVDSYTDSTGHIFNGGKNCAVCGEVNPHYVESTPTPVPQPQPTTTVPVQQTAQSSQTTTKSATTVKKPKSTSISKLTKGKKQFKVTWKKISGVAGYQIQYSTDKKFKKNVKTVTAKKSSTSATIKKLKSKKTYYVRIRTYKTVKINGKSTKVYSSWSKVKTVKTK